MLHSPEGFEEFVAVASPRLLRTAFLLTRDIGHAEDLLQTALAKAWRAWNRVDGDPEPYVRRIIVTSHATWWRRRWRGEEPTGELPERPGESPQEAVGEREWLWQALGRLPRRQRAVLVLRFYEDLTEAQVAGLLGCSVGTVKSQASKALAKLRLDDTITFEGVWR
ncbi:SigE family RNA polymerase sigma factor [Lentzea flaviverrucosa]|uniref:RNA polymerase sigma-70 factor, sigma-E family n=1 Tax=Lentzea flaviverrucosa TaxID=200379 RepID=A0A1H9GJ48_9PSEU|nr:SigE family RNA polymerase sigma factor [Lentzea flaviverrucosa]RDI34892.1 RNA polymerase sigma-70 factor (sigma-E family) [Lentzea flaviverrucosa]SEQ50126.1 RNA polymerase sigma-70 factor, sigma-E family [Lentzea flaviverrucosa]